MTPTTPEQRLAALESEVSKLRVAVLTSTNLAVSLSAAAKSDDFDTSMEKFEQAQAQLKQLAMLLGLASDEL